MEPFERAKKIFLVAAIMFINFKLQSLISQLLSYLHRSTAIPPLDGDTLGYFCTISQSDVAILLLQWALKHLAFAYPEFHSSTQKQAQSLKQERKTPTISESILMGHDCNVPRNIDSYSNGNNKSIPICKRCKKENGNTTDHRNH